MNQVKRIFIIGHPGAGKGLFAKAIANDLGWQFIDADFGLEFHIGKTLNEIVGKQGEESFYHCVSNLLADQLKKEYVVIATDANIVCSKKIIELLSDELIIYLQASTETQMERISRNPMPLAAIDVKSFLNKLHNERDHLYEKSASLIINSDINSFEEHVLEVVKTVSGNNESSKLKNNLKLNEKDLTLFHKITHNAIHLTDQQALCLKLLSQGKSSKEIARELSISYRTVEGHIAKTMELLGCSSSKELISLYHDRP